MVLKSRFPDLVIPKLDFYQYNIDKIKQYGDKIAVIDAANDRQLSYTDIHKASVKLASALTKYGLKKQEVVAVCASNCIEYSLIVLGIAACNAITTTCNPRHKKMEIQKQLENCRPKFVITDSEHIEKVLEIQKSLDFIEKVISVDPCSKCLSLWSIIEQDGGGDFPFQTTFDIHDDVALLLYSSGTTGLPKGVMLTHQNSIAIFTIQSGFTSGAPATVNYNVVPMFHVYGLNRLFNNLNGLQFVMDRRFNIEKFFKAVEKYKITSFNGVPALLMEITKSSLAKKYDMSSLKSIASGAAPLAPRVALNTMKKMNVMIGVGWGLTESGGLCSLGGLTGDILNTVGLLIPNYTLKVVDPDSRKELGVNEDGELLIKGPGVMKGYYKNPKANATVFEEGWLCTGDVGHYDEHGYVYIVDRIKELIKYKGFQVAPAELESLLLTHPKVLDVGVTGVPDPDAGEVPRAFVVKKDPSVTEQELHRFVEENLSKYKHLRGGIYFLDQIPRSDTGKILRRHLAKTPIKAKSKL